MTRAQEALWLALLGLTVLGIPVLAYSLGAGVVAA